MKALLILALVLISSPSYAGGLVRLDAQKLALQLKYAKLPATEEGRILKVILENTENLQLKDGTILEINTDLNKIDFDRNFDSIKAIESGLKRIPGGGGTGDGG